MSEEKEDHLTIMNLAAKQWVQALRSGKFLQTMNALRDWDTNKGQHGFCCLGVACEISGKGQWIDDDGVWQDESQATEEGEINAKYEDGEFEYVRSEEFLSPDVQAWLGLRTQDGQLTLVTPIGRQCTSLASLNDDGTPFSRIADIIEQHADQLFIRRSDDRTNEIPESEG